MKRALKWTAIGLAGVTGLAVIAAGIGYAALRNTVPSPSGTLAIADLTAPVEVVRDREGVPHIFARTTDDLYMALGFVHGPALLGIVAGSVLTAPLGARVAHRMPVATLRRIFAGLLYLLATKMLWTYL